MSAANDDTDPRRASPEDLPKRLSGVQYRPPSTVVAFPLLRHGREGIRWVDGLAARIAAVPETTGAKLLAAGLSGKADVLRRRGIDETTIRRELDAATTAIRIGAIARHLHGGGAA